jgi:glycerophosphoryl diester phosphodiesterase
MRTPTATLLFLMATLSSGCAGPEPRPDDAAGPARRTLLAQRLARQAAAAPLCVAHRGASAAHPENTLPAFRAALAADADLVELDFRQTADGVLVCMHDRSVDRTTDGAVRFGRDGTTIESVTARELATLDAGAWKGPEHAGARIPTLAEALATIQPGAVTMIEHKAGDPAALVELLRDKQLVGEVLVQSFDWAWLAEVRRLEPRLTLGTLGSGALDAARLAEIDALGVAMVHWHHQHLTLDDLTALRDRGYLVCVYTVDADLELLGCIAAGLDAITTDVPGRLRELLRDHRGSR